MSLLDCFLTHFWVWEWIAEHVAWTSNLCFPQLNTTIMSNATANSSIRPAFGGTVYRSPVSRLPPSGSKVSKLAAYKPVPSTTPACWSRGPAYWFQFLRPLDSVIIAMLQLADANLKLNERKESMVMLSPTSIMGQPWDGAGKLERAQFWSRSSVAAEQGPCMWVPALTLGH